MPVTDPTSFRPASSGSLVAVVVTHDRPAKLGPTVERLLASPPGHLSRLIVVDNASGPETAAILAGLDDPRVVVLRSEVNEGGAGGFARGMAHARDAFDPDWMLLMDDDGRPEPGCIARFHAADRTGAEVWTAAVFHPDGALCVMNRQSINPFRDPAVMRETLRCLVRGRVREGFHLAPAAFAPDAPAIPADTASFVGLFLSRRGLELAGLPDPRLFIYGDDLMFALALRAAGGRIVMDPALRFEHHIETLRHETDGIRPLWKAYYMHRNGLMVYRRASGRWFPLVAAFFVPKWALGARRYGARRGAFLRLLRLAVGDGWFGRLDRTHAEIVAIAEAGEVTD
jgi:GT2 family glycosyltransferase